MTEEQKNAYETDNFHEYKLGDKIIMGVNPYEVVLVERVSIWNTPWRWLMILLNEAHPLMRVKALYTQEEADVRTKECRNKAIEFLKTTHNEEN